MTNQDEELTASLVGRFKRLNNDERLLCCRCGRELQIGEIVHVKYGGSDPLSTRADRLRVPRYARLYHQNCWEKMFLEC
jgi:hypothetical protein